MYYLAAAFYFLMEPPASGFNPFQLFASLAFFNAWHPLLIPTVPDRWMVVPGGWSIGVEFTFYLLFPLIVTFIRSVKAAIAFFLAAVVLACLMNMAVYDFLATKYGVTATSNFIYFWLPNQLPIFTLGTVLFFLIDHLRNHQDGISRLFRKAPNAIILVCIAAFVLLAEFPAGIPATFHFSPNGLIPFLLLASFLFMAFSITLALNDRLLWTNRAICALGEVSFSAYILHFFVLHRLAHWLPAVDTDSTGYAAIKSLAILAPCTVVATFGLSKLTYRFIEQPAIRFGAYIAGLFVRVRPVVAAD
jgi:peptidoglycan/LPS O-acetylase OafA/YrhL